MTALERLLAIEDIRNLQARYVRIADSKDWHELSKLFTDDATFTSHDVAGNVTGKMSGRRAIATEVDAAVGDGIVIHHLFSHEIDITSSDTAHAIWSMEDWIDRTGDGAGDLADLPFRTMRGYGHYHIDYVRLDDGWLIASLRLQRNRLDFT
ncbi:nuclear transport factor 2 family protein [Novosphingobium sp. P6W]|uniref:nuclear transport factor 2 family protein n=1 Tax=Novosphingobium sp. P6W TaxID=1609758 RepID=UPI0005C321A2|nr:nuclear transport factor 2 family protein [Novosphingobium sp. P6W]AXB78905.1 nuclear transport factor 2 family protein [Novosphingobium sp. P6W]KIS30055.1 hypothetical protein TQ38_24895 [Novosphingobium sp. P6W]